MERDILPTPQTTLVILLGASHWPRWPDLHASKAFTRSVRGVKTYFLDKFYLPQANLLDLFDSDKSADDIDNTINQFLNTHIKTAHESNLAIRDVLLFYCGHAGFTEGTLNYYLALRRTGQRNPELSALQMVSLAKTLRKNTRNLRLMLILDCCYAAAAFEALHFQGDQPEEVARLQLRDVFQDSRKSSPTPHSSFPRKGVALLCSSSRSRVTLLDEQYTEFSEALLQILNSGSADEPGQMSLYTVDSLVKKSLLARNKVSKPEIHSPDQREGDIAAVPFFPNPQAPVIPRHSVDPAAVASRQQIQSIQSRRRSPRPGLLPKLLKALLALFLLLGGGVGAARFIVMQQHEVANQYATAVAAVLTPLAKATAAAATRAYWTETSKNGVQFGFDAAHTNWNPYERVLNTANVIDVKQLWSFSMRGPVAASPAVANGMIYVSADKFYAFDAACRHDCQPLWSFALGGSSSSPAVVNDMVYIGSGDGKLYAFDAICRHDCQPLWSFTTGRLIVSSPTVTSSMVYIGSSDGKLYAFDATCHHSCLPLWSFPLELDSSTPAVANGMVYIGSNDGNLYAFDATCRHSCRPLWSFNIGGSDSSLSVANGRVYIGSLSGPFYAFDAACRHDCQPLWSFDTRGPIYSSPAVARGIIYIGASDNGKLYAFDASCRSQCQPLWSFTTGERIFSSPTVANGVVYIGSQNDKLYAFDATCRRGCQPLWSFTAAGAIESSPAVANGVIYIGSEAGKFYALGA